MPTSNQSSDDDNKDNDDDGGGERTQFLVLSDSGKPIYSYGFRGQNDDDDDSDEAISRICALLQALMSSVPSVLGSNNNIQSLRSQYQTIVFMSMGALTLVAISRSRTGGSATSTTTTTTSSDCCTTETESYLRLQLEYIYCQIIFTVTSRIQESFTYNPSFDLRTLLGNTDTLINAILDESGAYSSCNTGGGGVRRSSSSTSTSCAFAAAAVVPTARSQYMCGSVEPVFPISPALRARASSALQVIGNKTEFTAFSILAVQDRLVSMIQPSHPDHQMRGSDLHLLLKTVHRQPHVLKSELWMPVCLPRFSSEEFLFCYTHCLDVTSQLVLILVSQQSTTHQFQLFQQAAARLRRSFDLPPASESVLEILQNNKDSIVGSTPQKDVRWRRNPPTISGSNDDDDDDDDDYVDASGEGNRTIPYIPSPQSVFLKDIQAACQKDTIQAILEHYCKIGSVLHFMFRFDARIQAAASRGYPGKLSQCLTAPLQFPFVDTASQQTVWRMYERLRLRLHSESTVESEVKRSQEGGTAQSLPALILAESSPKCADGIAFIRYQTEVYIGMNGPDYELYVLFVNAASTNSIIIPHIVLLFTTKHSHFLFVCLRFLVFAFVTILSVAIVSCQVYRPSRRQRLVLRNLFVNYLLIRKVYSCGIH